MSKEVMQALLKYEAKTGVFYWSEHAPKKVRNKLADAKDGRGYVCLRISGKMYKAHRIAWYFVHGAWPVNTIDHINGNKSDNRIENLREVSALVNSQNEHHARSSSSTGLLGVSPNGCKWRAEIRVDGKKKNLGTYATPELAHSAYLEGKRQLHEGCTI